jgi:hypothetical protein
MRRASIELAYQSPYGPGLHLAMARDIDLAVASFLRALGANPTAIQLSPTSRRIKP